MDLPQWVQSYRAFRFPWTATPAGTAPAALATRAAGASVTTVAASWNGATTVQRWQLLAGPTAASLAPVGAPFADTGFETRFSAPTADAYIAVTALGVAGRRLATSPATRVNVTG